ncbi:MAG: hypothetical protein CL608_21470 [Anaerolineaceae bacterium]|nr:hypothetical protein [Anaerolineaceae bacterium]
MFRSSVKLLLILLFLSGFVSCGGTTPAEDDPAVDVLEATAVSPTTPAATPIPATSDSSFDCTVVNEIPTAECQALVAFYKATNGTNWQDSAGWLQTTSPCSWLGVTCADGHVDMLGFYYNNLQGQLPTALADLTFLRVLDLHNNALTGVAPFDYGRLSNLEYIDLSVNQLGGSISEAIGDLVALQSLNLANNQLSGPIPATIGQIAPLRNLDLSYNQLNGELPASLANLTALESLRLRANQFTGAIPFGLGELPALAEIDLTLNQLSGTVPSALYEVAVHRLWGNQLDGTIFVGNDGRQDVNYLGAAFTLDTAVANSAFPELVPARAAEPGPGVLWAPGEHIVFTLTGAAGTENHNPMGLYVPAEAQIHIYQTALLNAEVQPAVDALQALLADPSRLAAYEIVSPEAGTAQPGLTMLPPSNAVVNLRAQVELLTFAEGSGVRYLTQLSQGPVPINNQDLFYTFQGLTDDGATYVAAYFPVSFAGLPDSPQINEEAFATLMADWQGYLEDTLALLNEQSAAAFTPDLAAVDALIQSLSVGGTTAVPSLNIVWPEAEEAVDGQPILQWEPFADAVNYHVVVLDDVAYPPQVVLDKTVTEPMLAVETALAPGHYSWTVWAQDGETTVLAELTSSFIVADE